MGIWVWALRVWQVLRGCSEVMGALGLRVELQ